AMVATTLLRATCKSPITRPAGTSARHSSGCSMSISSGIVAHHENRLLFLGLLHRFGTLRGIPFGILRLINDERRRITERLLPALKFRHERSNARRVFRLVSQVGDLIRIGLQVEELRDIDL